MNISFDPLGQGSPELTGNRELTWAEHQANAGSRDRSINKFGESLPYEKQRPGLTKAGNVSVEKAK